MGSARDRNRTLFGGLFGAGYSAYIERERLSRVIARIVWGSDVRHYYASMSALAEIPDGATVVDCPCGSGVALRAMRPSQRIHYLGLDLSPAMLDRARRRAHARGLKQAAFAESDAQRLPLNDETVDLFLSYFGLHCFDEPQVAVREAARCLRPGGRLVGSTIIRGSRLFDRLRVRPGVGGFGAVGHEPALRHWLALAAFEATEIDTRGIFAVFSATKPRNPPPGHSPT